MHTAHPAPSDLPILSAQSDKDLLENILQQYADRGTTEPMDQWLAGQLVQHTDLASPEAINASRTILTFLQGGHQLLSDLRAHTAAGKSRSSWIARQIENVAKALQVAPDDVAALHRALLQDPEALTTLGPQWNDITRIDQGRLLEQLGQRSVETLLSRLPGSTHTFWAEAREVDAAQPVMAPPWVKALLSGQIEQRELERLQSVLAVGSVIAAHRGELGSDVLEQIRNGNLLPEWFAHQTFISTEHLRILESLGRGEVDPMQAVDRMVDTVTASTTQVLTPILKRIGGQVGNKLALCVPYIGHFIAPYAQKAGEWVGAQVAKVAGRTTSEILQRGADKAKNFITSVGSSIKDLASSGLNAMRSLFSCN